MGRINIKRIEQDILYQNTSFNENETKWKKEEEKTERKQNIKVKTDGTPNYLLDVLVR